MPNITPKPTAGYSAPRGRASGGSGWPSFGRTAGLALILLTATAGAIARAEDAPEEPTVELEIEYPPDGLVLGPSACGLFVAGRAGPPKLDVVIAIDTSVSTAAASGADIDGDGELGRSEMGQIGFTVGELSTDPGDSILAAQIAAAARLASALDPRRTRVGLVSFSGGPADLVRGEPILPDALTRVPLTDDRTRLGEGLEALRWETPAGGTHMGAGLDRATIELLGLAGAQSVADPTRRRAVVLLTDGMPSRPYGPDWPTDNVRAALRAGDRAKRARIAVSTLAIGPPALEEPIAALEIAEHTGGAFIPVRDTGDLLAAIEEVDLGERLAVELANASTGEPARAFRTTPEGSWGGFVTLGPGANRIEVVARAASGGEARRTLGVTLDGGAPAPAVPREYEFLGDGAFGGCLRSAKRVDLGVEELEREQVRRQLLLEMERERAQARERAARQRKELELEPDVE